MDFNSLKTRNTMAELNNQMQKFKKKEWVDADQWKPARDPAGNGTAVIRFLPQSKNDTSPFVEIYTHSFKQGGKYFIENCPTSIGEPCPVCEANTECWAAGDEDTARDRKRTHNFWTNVYIIKDAQNPENNGKVLKFRFGKKIMEKIQKAIDGDPSISQDGIPVNDFWKGADFILRSKTIKTGSISYVSYDDSSFNSPSPLLGGNDELLKEIWESQFSLSSIVAPDQFKSYEQLSERFTGMKRLVSSETEIQTVQGDNSLNEFRQHVQSQPANNVGDPVPFSSTDPQNPMKYFEDLANE